MTYLRYSSELNWGQGKCVARFEEETRLLAATASFDIKKSSPVTGLEWLRFPDFMTTAQYDGKLSLTHRPPLAPGNTRGTHFC
jgi:hypothetical protein